MDEATIIKEFEAETANPLDVDTATGVIDKGGELAGPDVFEEEAAKAEGCGKVGLTLTEKVMRLRDLRESETTQRATIKRVFDALNETLKADNARLRETTWEKLALETEIREASLKIYSDSKNADPAPGIKVKVGTDYKYDSTEAFKWAKEHALCIVPESLDLHTFEQLCKAAATRPAFVEVVESPTVAIAKDLSKVLPAAAQSEAGTVSFDDGLNWHGRHDLPDAGNAETGAVTDMS